MRILIAVVLLVAIVLVARLYRGWRAGSGTGSGGRGADLPLVPESITAGAARTWVVFTTPTCAACGPVEARLRASDPTARVVKVDASREPHLAGAFSIRTAPTVLLADADGRVRTRLVGAAAVDRWAAARAQA
jgi:hypothetical protein